MTDTRTRDNIVWHDLECGAYAADLPLWSDLAAAAEGGHSDVLELGCGTGRVALPLGALRHRVTGIDTDAELVEELNRRAAEHGLDVEAVVADARSFSLGRTFDLVLAPMQVVQLLRGRAERTAMLSRIRSHLRPGATVAIALLGPEEEWMAAPEDAPFPDMREESAWVYSSLPIAVRLVEDGTVLLLERKRQTVSPAGEVHEPLPSREIPPTEDHIGSTVVLLRKPR
jgi:SAM-dependent methyltransferase